jgi:hypothetical protein
VEDEVFMGDHLGNHRMLPLAVKQDAKTLSAAAATLPTCHLAMLEDPEKVAAVIDQAAKQVLSKRQARHHTWARSSSGVSA